MRHCYFLHHNLINILTKLFHFQLFLAEVMFNLNFWFVPRTRSTVMLRCLSNIPDSTIYFEKFCWARHAEKKLPFLNELGFDASNFETRDQILAQLQNDTKKYKTFSRYYWSGKTGALSAYHAQRISKYFSVQTSSVDNDFLGSDSGEELFRHNV